MSGSAVLLPLRAPLERVAARSALADVALLAAIQEVVAALALEAVAARLALEDVAGLAPVRQIGPAAGDDGVAAVLAEDLVGFGTGADQIAAASGEDLVVALVGDDHVATRGARDHVVTGRPDDRRGRAAGLALLLAALAGLAHGRRRGSRVVRTVRVQERGHACGVRERPALLRLDDDGHGLVAPGRDRPEFTRDGVARPLTGTRRARRRDEVDVLRSGQVVRDDDVLRVGGGARPVVGDPDRVGQVVALDDRVRTVGLGDRQVRRPGS